MSEESDWTGCSWRGGGAGGVADGVGGGGGGAGWGGAPGAVRGAARAGGGGDGDEALFVPFPGHADDVVGGEEVAQAEGD